MPLSINPEQTPGFSPGCVEWIDIRIDNMKIWINGSYISEDNAKIPVSDRGFLYGDGVFESMRSYAGVIFKLDRHLARLGRSLQTARIKAPYSTEYLKGVLYRCLKVNGLSSANLRITITRGEGRFVLHDKKTLRPNIVISAKGLGEDHERPFERGISAACSAVTRQDERSALSGIKSLNYMGHILARIEAERGGFDEAILLNTRGYVTECASSNIFLVKDGALMTPSLDCGILPGITRGVIIDIAKRLRIKLREKHILSSELLHSDEVFMTNSIFEVLPVTRVDGRKIGAGKPGDITQLLRISYQKEVIRAVLNRD